MTERLLPAVAADQGGRAGAARGAGAERLLDRRRLSARRRASTSGAPSRCAAAAWSRPALHDADQTDLTTLMRALQRSRRARARRLAQELRAGRSDDHGHQPRRSGRRDASSASSIRRRSRSSGSARSRSGRGSASARIEARPLVTATLSADHRASDGHRGGLFLTAIDRLLQTPEKL